MTEAQRLTERVEVVVRPHNRYGDALAGARLAVTRQELLSHARCLEEVKGPAVPAPRTARVSIPAHAAITLGFPVGRRQEGPLVFEVTRLPPDGKPPLPSREDLERAARSGAATAEAQEFAAAFGWEEDDGDPTAWIKKRLPTIKEAFADAHHAAQRADAEIGRRGAALEELAAVAKHREQRLGEMHDTHVAQLAKLNEEFAAKDAEVTRVRIECTADLTKANDLIAQLRAELEAARQASAPAQQAPAAPPLPKGAKEK